MNKATIDRVDELRRQIAALQTRLHDLQYAERPDAHTHVKYENGNSTKALHWPSLDARVIHAIECEANAVRYELNQAEMELEAL